MEIIYNAQLKGWQIIHIPNQFIKKEVWHKPVNNKVYESWGSAMHDLDKWAE